MIEERASANDPVPMQRKVIAGDVSGPHLLILGGVHGDEFESMSAIRRLMKRFEPADLRGRVTFIPVVNEPAYWRGQRAAADGLDLARTCPGRPDGSITERIADAVSAEIRAADFLVDLHSGGVVMRFLPTVGYTLHPDPRILDTQRRMATAFDLPIVWGTTSQLDGRTLSVARNAGIPAIYAEWMGGGECDPAGVEAYVEGCLGAMGELDMIDRELPPSRIEHVVEDDRDEAGHIQVNYPAPFDGFFESQVELEQPVRPGDTIGVVTDHLGDREEAVVSVQTGVVLCLRLRHAEKTWMSVLVDSSAWIDYFRGSGRHAGALDQLIDEDLVVVNDLILAELLPALHMRRQRKLIRLLREVARRPVDVDWEDIVQLRITCLRNGINKVGIPDLIIAQHALQNGLELLSRDQHFSELSKHVPLFLH